MLILNQIIIFMVLLLMLVHVGYHLYLSFKTRETQKERDIILDGEKIGRIIEEKTKKRKG